MSQDPPTQRYRTMEPSEIVAGQREFPPEDEKEGKRPIDRAIRYLTWGILGVCLALWGIVGFILWVPLLLRSMLHFSFALSEGMLQGAKPTEAGRILRETVEFYRRGFTVAIDAVFGPPPRKQEAATKLSLRRILLEILWAVVVWYFVLFLVGFAELSPVEIWNAVVAYPWGEAFQSTVDWVTGLFSGFGGGEDAAAVAADSLAAGG